MKKNKFQIVSQTTAGKADIRIVDYISELSDASSFNIRALVDNFLSQGITNAQVYVNSKGGDVFEAVEIANELKRFSSVSIAIGSIAASAATYITSMFYTVAKPNTKVMIHRPRLTTSGTVNEIESDLKMARDVTEDYKKVYAKKTGKTVDQIEALWAQGDYWMNAVDAKNEGFIDLIDYSREGQHPSVSDSSIQASFYGLKMEALGYYTGWTLDDYLDKDIAAYERMRTTHPGLAALLEGEYFGTKNKAVSDNEASIKAASRNAWTLDDYLDNDPEAYKRMKTDNPEAARRLEAAYFNSK